MAQNSPFLQGIFDPLRSEDNLEDSATLPGQQPTRPAAKQGKPVAAQADVEPVQAAPAPARAAPSRADVIKRALDLDVDPELALSFFRTESSGNFNSKDSPKGAVGGFQVMPGTYKQMMGTADGQRNPWNNMEAGLRYIAHGQKVLGTKDPELLAAGYHAGYGREELKRGEIPDTNDGIMSTRAYAQKVAGGARKAGGQPGYIPLTDDEIAGLEKAGKIPAAGGGYVPLTDDEVTQLKLPTLAPPAERGFVQEYITDPLKRGYNSLKQGLNASGAMFDARQLEVIGRIDKGEKVPDQDDALGYQYMNAEQRAAVKKKMGEAFVGAVKDTTELGKKVAAIPQDPIVAKAQQAKSFDEWWGYFKQAPIKFIANTGVESLPQMAPGLLLGGVAGAASRSIAAGAAGMGAGSYAVDFPSTVLGALADKGIDTNDPEALATAFSDKKLMEDVRQQAHAHAAVVGTLDAVSGGRAGATVVGGKTIARRAANLGAKTVEQGALGAAGEAGGQIAQGKDQLEWGAIAGEFAGELAGAPAEIAGATKLQAQESMAARRAADAEAPAAAPVPPVAAPPATPGMMTRAVEDAADSHAKQPNRVTATAPDGQQVSGQVAAYQEEGDGHFIAQVVGDDGQVHTLDSRTGVQVTPEAAPEAGPLSAALTAAAEDHAARTEPQAVPEVPVATVESASLAPVAEAAAQTAPEIAEAPAVAGDQPLAEVPVAEAPAPRAEPAKPADMSDDELRTRMQYLSAQFRNAGDRRVQAKMALERKAIEREINARAAAQATQGGDNVQVRTSDTTATGELGDAGNAGRAAPAAQAGRNRPAGRARTAQPVVDRAASAAAAVPDAGPAVPGEGAAAVEQPALIARNPYQAYSADSQARAEAYMAKRGADPELYEVRQTGKVRWQVVPKEAPAAAAPEVEADHTAQRFDSELAAKQYVAKQKIGKQFTVAEGKPGEYRLKAKPQAGQAPTRKADKLAAAREHHARQDALVQQAVEKAAARKSEQVPATAAPIEGESNASTEETSTSEEASKARKAPAEADVLTPKQEPRRKKEMAEPRYSVTPEQAAAIDMKTKMPTDPLFAEAVANTSGASIGPDGLRMTVVRFQKEEQDGEQSVRTGVFYLPTGSAAAKHYKTGKTGYGGTQKHEGETVLRAPLFVKGATGGKAPEVAYDAIKGKNAYEKMRADVLRVATGWGKTEAQKYEGVYQVLEQYGADPGMADDIVRNSREGNTLPYAVQENIVAHAVREAGYDSVVGYSKGKAGASISEVFDVREATYPARGMDSDIHPHFKMGAYSVSGDDIASAIDRLMADKSGEAKVTVPGLGEVTIPYGDDKAGLAHIEKRRGADFIKRLPELLANGSVYTKGNQKDRVFLGNDRDEAVISLTRDGEDDTWLLSAYEKYPDLKESRRSEVAEDKMPDGKFFTKDDLRKSLTSQGVLGQVIASMIDSGIVVLHGGPTKLPGGVGRRVKSVQAVTMPDGTIHMVASNLTPRTALPVMLHEMFHQGGEKLVGGKEWGNLMGRLGSLYRQSEQSSGKAREFYDRARARVEAARRKGAVGRAMEVEEFAAYAIEEYEKDPRSLPAAVRKWVEDLLGLVKTFMVKKYGKQLGAVTPAQLSAMARWALMDVAVERRGEMFGPLGEMFSADTDQTDTPAFKKWFGDSKVVDENGAPLVLHHGTTNADKILEAGFKKGWVHLTDSKEVADSYQSWDKGNSADTLNLYVKAINPAYYDANGQKYTDIGNKVFRATADAERAGHDALIIKNIRDNYDSSVPTKPHTTVVAFSPKQIKSADMNTGAFDPSNADIRFSVADDTSVDTGNAPSAPPSYTPPEQGRLRRLQAALQDNMNRVAQVQETIMAKTGRTTLGKADYRGAEINRPGRIAARLEDFREGQMQPLIERLAKAGYKPEQLESLLHAMHATERNKANAKVNPKVDPDSAEYGGTQGSGMNDDVAEEILKQYAGDATLHELAKEARAIARATLDMKRDYGLMKPEDHELLTTRYENYIPLKGDAEYGAKVKRSAGHETRDEHILENIARDYEQAVVVGEKNRARMSLLQMVLKFADPELWTVGVPPKGRYIAGKTYSVERNGKSEGVFTSMPQVQAFLEAKGAEAANYTVLDSAGEQVKEFTKPLQDNEVIVYVNGDPVRIQIHDEKLASQLRPLDQGKMNIILEGMRTVNRYLSKIYTGYNPAFIFKNAARDALTGTINMAGNQGAAVAGKAWMKYPAAIKAMAQWAATKQTPDGKMGAYLDEYRMHGGKTGASYMSDLEEQGKTLQTMFDDARGLAATAKDGSARRAAAVAWRKSVGKLAHVVEIANQASENALRLSLYVALREEGNTPAKAAQAAKSVTVDFDRKGTQTGMLGAIYLFLNPAIQGTANAMKTLTKGEHKAQAWAALGGLAMLGAYAASKGMDDDKDRWLGHRWDERTKSLMLNFGGHDFKLPLSQEFAPAYAVGAGIAEALHGEKPMQVAGRVLSSFIDAYFPLQGAVKPDSNNHLADAAQAVTPTVAKPIIEAAFNRDSFGSQVVPENKQTEHRPDNLKMNRGTKGSAYDAAAQLIAAAGEKSGYAGKYENDITKVSPETLKSLWRTYTGGLGTFVTDAIGAGRLALEAPGSMELADVPVVKDFVRGADAKPIRDRYRDLADDAEAAITEFREAKKAADSEAMQKIAADADKLRLVGLGKMIQSTNKALAALGDAKVDVNQSKELSVAEKRAALKAIERQEEELYRVGIAAFTQ